jgi:glycosyltransferase involved in cell wall biosynthesis
MKPQKIRVIYNGLNVEEIEEQLATSRSIEKPFGFTVCTVGELTERKGVSDLLSGFAGFLRQSKAKDAGFVFLGEGEKKQKQLVDLADRLNIGDKILFTGFLKNPYPYISASDVYVANSKNEGISNALLEAMYLKKAVITTDAGGTEEFIRHRQNGLLIQREAPEELAESLSILYRNKKLRERLAEEGCRTIMEKFSLARMKEEIVSFCEELMDGRNT